MAKIIEIDTLVPEDIELNYRGKTYTVPGDISVPDVLKLFTAVQVVMADQTEVTDARAAQKKLDGVEREVLRIINISRGPDEQLDKSPFGQRSLGIVLVEILKHLLPDMFEESSVPPSPTPAAIPARPSTSKRKSSRSSPSVRARSKSPRSTGSPN